MGVRGTEGNPEWTMEALAMGYTARMHAGVLWVVITKVGAGGSLAPFRLSSDPSLPRSLS